MNYRIDAIEVPDEDIYKYDVLQRKPIVEFLGGLIKRAGGPFVIALDSPYGTGKSTLVSMLKSSLTNDGYQCIYFNAWQLDYVTDPLVAMVSALDQVSKSAAVNDSSLAAHLKILRKVTTVIAKRSMVASVKAATLGALDLDDEIESIVSDLAGDTTLDIVSAFQKEAEQLSKFRKELTNVVKSLPPSGKKESLIFFVDELDRCRPTFAIELLERIKHLFDVPGITFVLSVDKKQLEASTASVYGSGINAPEYLRKFIDLEYGLPQVAGKKFTEMLLGKFDLNDIFSKRTGSEIKHDRQNFIEFFSWLADLTEMSLRTRERCIARMKVVLDQTPSDHYLHPIEVALLIVLRTKEPALFSAIIRGHANSDEVMAYLRQLPGGGEFELSRPGIRLESLIIWSSSQSWKDKKLAAIAQAHKDGHQADRNKDLLHLIGLLSQGWNEPPSLALIGSKIDIAVGIN